VSHDTGVSLGAIFSYTQRVFNMSGLISQVESRRKEIFTDSYPMSIGELVNLYRDGELDINPSFQRFFRWSDEQKVNLIESVILGIPLPSIFISQREDGVWDLVDGLQRISTILSFMNELKNEEGKIKDSLTLHGTKYLPALEGVSWNGGGGLVEFDSALKISFKREKVDIKIIKKESDGNTKFELFQRLNTGGSELSEQEVRNCLLIMLDPDAYAKLVDASNIDTFKKAIAISDRLYDQRYDMELLIRLIFLANADSVELKGITDISSYLTNNISKITTEIFDWDKETGFIHKSFSLIFEVLGDNSFNKYDKENDRYKGGFQISLYELIATGTYELVKRGVDDDKIKELIDSISKSAPYDEVFNKYSGSGSKASYRWPKMHELVKEYFIDESKK